MAVRILGIDPGTVVMGFACIDTAAPSTTAGPPPLALRARNAAAAATARGRVELVACGIERLGRGQAVGTRLARLADVLDALLERLDPDELAVEEAFAGKSVQSALRVGEARGVVLAIAARRGLAIHQYPPATIKRCVAGHGAASKEAVAEMACRALGLAGLAGPADASDALAVALCHHERRQTPQLRTGW